MGSVVYVGRGAFRMEAVGPDGLIADLDGVVQPVTGMVTAPYHGHAPGENTGVDRLPVSATFRAPDLPSLFGSQTDVPLLEAPTGIVQVEPRRQAVALPRAALAALGTIVFACGVVIGAAALRPQPVPSSAARTAVPTPVPVAVAVAVPAPVAAAPEPELAPPTTIASPAPVKIAVHKKVARPVAAAPRAVAEAPAKPWVDPFAE